jgi:hypothetical protein
MELFCGTGARDFGARSPASASSDLWPILAPAVFRQRPPDSNLRYLVNLGFTRSTNDCECLVRYQ